MKRTPQLPASLGYRMPAEWEPHASTWLAWPHNKEDWPGKFDPIPWVYAEIIRNLARHERVDVVVQSERDELRARAVLERANALSANVVFHRWPTDRVWTRDSGCIFLTPGPQGLKPSDRDAAAGTAEAVPYPKADSRKSQSYESRTASHGLGPSARSQPAASNQQLRDRSKLVARSSLIAALHFRFNAWAKYDNYKFDATVGARMAKVAGARIVQPEFTDPQGEKHRIVLEGGAIDVNGRGTLLTTEECLLSTTQQRNPGMHRAAYEQMFAAYFGIQSVIWLGDGVEGDDTHGHVDDLSRFVSPDTVVTMIEENAQDGNYLALHHNLGRLRAARDQDGHRLNVVEIPMPRPVVFEGRRLPASYANFYIANGCVLVPVFNDPNDRRALATLAEVFADREIVPIYSGDLIWGFGALHCMTQQQPKT
jgi:agmatine deiminase